jgi:YesN/AraC family two-component response regulator
MTYEIAETVGFKNVETFARVFKKITGKTPRDFS